jgi:triosephosphate isomerase (TIM)
MRKKVVAGNWKMNLDIDQANELASGICQKLQASDSKPEAQVVFFPPFVYLTQIIKIADSQQGVFAGAQNCHQNQSGAFTGEVSASMLKSIGATHVIIGHSERRTLYMENDDLLAAKTRAALDQGLIVVFCCGELLPQREAAEHFNTVRLQLQKAIFGLTQEDFKNVIIAYEPVWAIGTGVTASPEQAQEMHEFIRGLIRENYDQQTADSTSILYGGSCNAQNAAELFGKPDVDGGLIGGASLKVNDFYTIINSF